MAKRLQVERFLGYRLSEEERREILEELFVFGKDKQRPYLKRMAVLLVISTIIATCGLLANSAAVVIGAMLVAPLMRPVMSAAAAITLGWTDRLNQALLLTLCMAVAAILIGMLLTWLSPHMVVIPEQVQARTQPTFFDLFIALAAGTGGAYVMTRKESSSIPGVAMAVALLPPLASSGILIVLKHNDLAFKAFVLFFTNFAAMVLAGALTFIIVGIAPVKSREKSAKTVRNYLIIFTLLVLLVSVPLYFYSEEVWYDASYQANQSEELQNWLAKNQLMIDSVKIDVENEIIYMHLLGPNPPLKIETLHTELRKARIRKTGEDIPFNIEVGWSQQIYFSWPPASEKNKGQRELRYDYSSFLINNQWHWIGTQYADGNWLKPAGAKTYSINMDKDENITVKTSCKQDKGKYIVQQEKMEIEIEMDFSEAKCMQRTLDEIFVSDLNDIINLSLDENRLWLRIDGDYGLMYFEHD